MSETNSFERLVTKIDQDERLDLLRRMRAAADTAEQSMELPAGPEVDEEQDMAVRLRSETFFTRLWIFLKSLFSGTKPELTYNQYLTTNIAKNVEYQYPDIFTYRTNNLLSACYYQLNELKKIADYFKSGISLYEDDQGAFFVFLGSLVMPDFSGRMSAEVDPYALPLNREVTAELRNSLLRKMDDLLQSIPQEQKNHLYTAVRSLEWLRHFVHLPYERFISRFSQQPGVAGTFYCPVDAAGDEIARFARILCNGRRIHPEVLEALYLIPREYEKSAQSISDEQPEEAASADIYMEKSFEKIAAIRTFITSVPLQKLGAIAFNSAFWIPEKPEGIEDWFVKYKNHWRKLFDIKWEAWLKDKKKDLVRNRLRELFQIDDFPLLQYRPWLDTGYELKFSREYSLGFLQEFFQKLYPAYAKPLKILLGEGEFVQKDNRVEFTDAYNEFNIQAQNLDKLFARLGSGGSAAVVFAQAASDAVRTLQTKNKLDSLMKSIESEASVIVAQFCSACRSMQLILNGILSERREKRYDTLVNITTIQGRSNAQFRQQLQNVAVSLGSALEIIRDLESVEI